MAAFGLYTHIQANRRRSIALVIGLFVLVYVLTFAFALLWRAMDAGPPVPGGGLQDYLRAAARDLLWLAPVATAATALWVWLGAKYHQGIIDAVTGSEGVEREANPRLYNLVENLCIAWGLPVPRVRIMDSPVLNAFATGMRSDQYAITVTRGLVEALDDAELEAVLAHELTHIRNEDVRLMVTAVIIAGVISFFGELVFRWFDVFPRWSGRSSTSESRSDSKGKGGGAFLAVLIALALIAVAWALSLVIRFALSRSREYLADAGSVELTKNPDAMISALLKISGRGELEGVPSGLIEMCVDNPRSGFADLFATHPAIEDRIDALVRYAGGHRPPPLPELPAGPEAPGPWGPASHSSPA
ncbi:MAG TPA: M48 family metallopeptidase [Beijerinckiaceae bacterium]|nr:M48 family metallopeptidase [Beijerinckiaceae bacterium]